MSELFFVTTNRNKVEEALKIVSPYSIQFKWKRMKKLEIQSDDPRKVSSYSASLLFKKLRKPLIVEDTALYIDLLNGFPGCYSSYVNAKIGCSGIVKLLEGKESSALFVTSVSFTDGKKVRNFVGKLKGKVIAEQRGEKVFGFDPIFVPDGLEKTLAELTLDEKCSISHRAIALKKFARWYTKGFSYMRSDSW